MIELPHPVMPDTLAPSSPRQAWARHMARIGADHGFFHRLGRRHAALYVQEGETLVLSFDRADALWDQGDTALPLGFDLVQAREWSLLSLMSFGRTWFRETEVEVFLTTLTETGFFAGFDQVLIVAHGPQCTHAAARMAAQIPGARVLLSSPVAAVGATDAPFETRFAEDRRRGNPDLPPPLPPEALQEADQTFVLFDPTIALDAAQAAMLRAPNTERLPLPAAGASLEAAMRSQHVLVPVMTGIANGSLTRARLRTLLRRSIRRDPAYIDRIRTLSGVPA